MAEQEMNGSKKSNAKLSRRTFIGGAAVGAAGMWAAAVLPRRAFTHDPHRPPQLYEYFLDNFWFDAAGLYDQKVNSPLKGTQKADIVIVGGGFAGMASAYHLIRRYPDKRIVLLEGACCGYGASGRNGGMALTGIHGLIEIFEKEGGEAARKVYDTTVAGLERIKDFVEKHEIDCDLELTGKMVLATEERHIKILESYKRLFDGMGLDSRIIEKQELQKSIKSERYIAGWFDPLSGIINPAKLARGMKNLIEGMGVEVFERSRAMRIVPGKTVRVVTEFGEIESPNTVVTLNGYAPQIGYFKNRVLPLTSYIIATEPLTTRQMDSIGWSKREGLLDMRVLFDYFRWTADNRIVFGGEMYPYFYDGSPSTGNYQPTIDELTKSLFITFPQLEGVKITHSWGGTMGFTLDFLPSVGVMGEHKNIYYGVGFCGEGVVMTQLAGEIISQLLAGEQSELTRLHFVNRKMPFTGVEPFRYPFFKLYEEVLKRVGTNTLL